MGEYWALPPGILKIRTFGGQQGRAAVQTAGGTRELSAFRVRSTAFHTVAVLPGRGPPPVNPHFARGVLPESSIDWGPCVVGTDGQ